MSGGLIDVCVCVCVSVLRVSELQAEWAARPPAACRSVSPCRHQNKRLDLLSSTHVSPTSTSPQAQS